MYYLNFLILLLLMFLNSCSQNFQNNGLSEKKIKTFNAEIGKTSKQQLIKNYGPPIFEDVFNNNIIYYVSHNTSYKTFEKRKTNKLLVFKITLDDNKIIKELKKYTENDNIDLDISKDEDNNDLDFTIFWKDMINAMRRKNVDN